MVNDIRAKECAAPSGCNFEVERLARYRLDAKCLKCGETLTAHFLRDALEALQDVTDDSYSLIEQPSWIRPATGLGVYRCHQCEATKGDTTRPHAVDCAVGKAEVILA